MTLGTFGVRAAQPCGICSILREVHSQNQRAAHWESNTDLFHKQNLAKKRTQDAKMLEDSSELFPLCPPLSVPSPPGGVRGLQKLGEEETGKEVGK